MFRWLVWAPPLPSTSGGVRVLHRLAWWLQQIGEDASVPAPGVVPGVEDDPVVVYPEIVHGNPWRARRTVRYCLNAPGAIGGDLRYPPTELVVTQQPYWQAAVERASGHPVPLVYFSIIDPAVFYPGAPEGRDSDLLFLHKGRGEFKASGSNRWGTTRELDGRLPEADVGNALRRARRLVSYDHVSSILPEAQICGAEVVLATRHGTRPYGSGDFMWQPNAEQAHASNLDAWQSAEPVSRLTQLVREKWDGVSTVHVAP